ncbi:MAG: putative Cytochrome c (Modular protein) [Candidatus Nitrospira kreftii]|uniref:Putative Cytochrome c (Modular protein) n=1 Tax=Candidatus Nitrospira kreftii TaxID=2652173 RepID=A0A7S8FI30_9BACT|nr:MAG: putative Cytochrome c (Modular protein) [Candidatus Nitrospira kreftii]
MIERQACGFVTLTVVATGALISWGSASFAADEAVLKPRVPIDQIETVKAWTNPLPATEETIEKGKRLFQGKAFCMTCHGKDGKGLGADIEPGTLRGPLPRNFTDQDWQKTRTDGELFWILKNGSKGTAMAPFIPLILTEEEAWQVLRYVRSFGQTQGQP